MPAEGGREEGRKGWSEGEREGGREKEKKGWKGRRRDRDTERGETKRVTHETYFSFVSFFLMEGKTLGNLFMGIYEILSVREITDLSGVNWSVINIILIIKLILHVYNY